MTQDKTVYLVASGDLRLSANKNCWNAQEEMEERLIAAFAREGMTVRRGHDVDPIEGHGFISSQRMGMDVFAGIDPDSVNRQIADYSRLLGRFEDLRARSVGRNLVAIDSA